MRKKKLQKTELLPIERPERIAAWLNDMPPSASRGNSLMTETVHREISRHAADYREVPEQVRMNPWDIFELPSDRWDFFLFMIEGRIVSIPIVPDGKVCVGRVHCVGTDETVIAMRAVRA